MPMNPNVSRLLGAVSAAQMLDGNISGAAPAAVILFIKLRREKGREGFMAFYLAG